MNSVLFMEKEAAETLITLKTANSTGERSPSTDETNNCGQKPSNNVTLRDAVTSLKPLFDDLVSAYLSSRAKTLPQVENHCGLGGPLHITTAPLALNDLSEHNLLVACMASLPISSRPVLLSLLGQWYKFIEATEDMVRLMHGKILSKYLKGDQQAKIQLEDMLAMCKAAVRAKRPFGDLIETPNMDLALQLSADRAAAQDHIYSALGLRQTKE